MGCSLAVHELALPVWTNNLWGYVYNGPRHWYTSSSFDQVPEEIDGRDFFYSGPTTNSCLPLSWLQRYNLKGFPSMRCCFPLNWLQRFNLNGFPTRRCCPPLRTLSVNIPDMYAYVHSSYPLLVDTRQPWRESFQFDFNTYRDICLVFLHCELKWEFPLELLVGLM